MSQPDTNPQLFALTKSSQWFAEPTADTTLLSGRSSHRRGALKCDTVCWKNTWRESTRKAYGTAKNVRCPVENNWYEHFKKLVENDSKVEGNLDENIPVILYTNIFTSAFSKELTRRKKRQSGQGCRTIWNTQEVYKLCDVVSCFKERNQTNGPSTTSFHNRNPGASPRHAIETKCSRTEFNTKSINTCDQNRTASD